MPSTSEILAGLTQAANDAFVLAVLWHALLGLALIAGLAGWRPSRRLVAVALAAPLASVSAVAWATGNPFNGGVFALVAVALVVLARGAAHEPIELAAGWTLAAGVALAAFGWAYPHFLVDRSPLAYVYGAPLGLIPCPSLSMSIGLALVTGAPGGRAWSAVLAVTGVVYALIGALRFGVWIDLALLVGATVLLARSVRWPRRWQAHGLRGA